MPRKGIRHFVQEIRDHKRNCAVHDLTFCWDAALTSKQKKAVEKYLVEHFDLWWNSWIAPRLAEIEKRAK